MNSAHLHLALNHLPVVGIIFVLVLGAAAYARRSHELERAALWGFMLVAAMAVPAYLTGEPAEDMVEQLAGVSGTAIEVHEDSAAFALALIEMTGLLALAALLVGRRGNGRGGQALYALVLLSALVAAGVLVRTAYLGGSIRHTELRSSAPAAAVYLGDFARRR